jgi:hypothetical protein
MPRNPLLQTTALARPPSLDQHLKARATADRYNTTIRTLNRWVEKGVIPAPDLIVCGKRYWKLATLEEADRRNTANAMTKFLGRAKFPAAAE